MRKTYLLMSCVLTLMSIYACNSLPTNRSGKNLTGGEIDDTNAIHITFDPDTIKEIGTTSDFLDSITFVPLETTPESRFSEIDQLEVTSKYYIVWDASSNAILYFDKKGRYLKKIVNTDTSLIIPFKKIDQFSINTETNELTFSDVYSPYMYIYTLDGTYKKHVKKPTYLGVSYYTLKNVGLYYQGYNGKMLGASTLPTMNLYLTYNGKEQGFFFPFDTTLVDYTDVFNISKNFYNNQDGTVNFIKAYDYNVYSINTDGRISNTYCIDLPPARTVPTDFMIDGGYMGKRMSYTNMNGNVIYSITDFFKVGNTIVFKLIGHAYSQSFIYNIESRKLFSLSGYISDALTHLLPIMDQKIHAVDLQGHLVSSVAAVTLFQAKLDMIDQPDWYKSLPISLKKFYESDNLQNPVLTLISSKQLI